MRVLRIARVPTRVRASSATPPRRYAQVSTTDLHAASRRMLQSLEGNDLMDPVQLSIPQKVTKSLTTQFRSLEDFCNMVQSEMANIREEPAVAVMVLSNLYRHQKNFTANEPSNPTLSPPAIGVLRFVAQCLEAVLVTYCDVLKATGPDFRLNGIWFATAEANQSSESYKGHPLPNVGHLARQVGWLLEYVAPPASSRGRTHSGTEHGDLVVALHRCLWRLARICATTVEASSPDAVCGPRELASVLDYIRKTEHSMPPSPELDTAGIIKAAKVHVGRLATQAGELAEKLGNNDEAAVQQVIRYAHIPSSLLLALSAPPFRARDAELVDDCVYSAIASIGVNGLELGHMASILRGLAGSGCLTQSVADVLDMITEFVSAQRKSVDPRAASNLIECLYSSVQIAVLAMGVPDGVVGPVRAAAKTLGVEERDERTFRAAARLSAVLRDVYIGVMVPNNKHLRRFVLADVLQERDVFAPAEAAGHVDPDGNPVVLTPLRHEVATSNNMRDARNEAFTLPSRRSDAAAALQMYFKQMESDPELGQYYEPCDNAATFPMPFALRWRGMPVVVEPLGKSNFMHQVDGVRALRPWKLIRHLHLSRHGWCAVPLDNFAFEKHPGADGLRFLANLLDYATGHAATSPLAATESSTAEPTEGGDASSTTGGAAPAV